MKKRTTVALSILIALAALSATWLLARRVTIHQFYNELQRDPITAKAAEVSAYLDYYFIDDYDEKTLADAAASALVAATGDEWSYYVTSDEYQAYEENMNNAYVGIGVTILLREEDGGYMIDSVTQGSPAQESGIEPGDILLQVEGQDTLTLGTSGTRELVRGEEGTSVHLKLCRGEETFELDVMRRNIEVEVAVSRMLENGIGYVKINNFDERCFDETAACIDDLLAQGAKAFIFDVRFNGGGYRDELVKLLDKLLPEGVLFRSLDYAGDEEADESDPSCIELPMAVLINRDSYSAAEFFAAALQEYDWAEIVGEKTGGKGNFQIGIPLSDGSLLNISAGKYFTPQGRSLSQTGVSPDVEVPVDDETYLKLYNGQLSDSEDAQLQAALKILADKIS